MTDLVNRGLTTWGIIGVVAVSEVNGHGPLANLSVKLLAGHSLVGEVATENAD